MTRFCGWDIGGVHIKGAICDGPEGGGLDWRIEPFAIWREPDGLAPRLRAIAAGLGASLRDGPGVVPCAAHAITMTAELSDVYPDRAAGVRAIVAAAGCALGPGTRVLDLDGGLVSLGDAVAAPERVGAANWVATAALAARVAGDGVLIDIGSTTTDIVPLAAGRPAPTGRTDLERLACGELVYTGFLRTPPAALVDRVPLRGGTCRVAPEHFTIMADARVLLGVLHPEDYTVDTPDGRGRTPAECAARLARLVCSDPETVGAGGLRAIAARLDERQEGLVAEAVIEVARRCGAAPTAVVAGSGAALAAAAARRAGLRPVLLSDLIRLDGGDSGARSWDLVAPAVALALLAAGTPA